MTADELSAALAHGRVEGADLSNIDWQAFAVEGACFAACRFAPGRFSRIVMAETRFEECVFVSREGDPAGCTFSVCDMRACCFDRCDLSLCHFERCDLFEVEMEQCQLRGARFVKPDFSHAYSRKLVSTRASLRNCNFQLADLSEARLPGCDLTGSRFGEADLRAADLSDAVLRDCDLLQAVLTRAKLDGADLRGAEVSGLNLAELASFAGLKIDAGQQHALLAGLGVVVEAG